MFDLREELIHTATYMIDKRNRSELYHHGILGMKWGVRRYQNEDGSLTPAGRSRYGVKKLEKETINRAYKEKRANGGHYLLKQYRRSTGANYDKAMKDFGKHALNDKTYRELSKKAFDAEYKRLMAEKPYVDDDDKYGEYWGSKQSRDLTDASVKAKQAKDDYVKKLAQDYVDVIKDAKIKDMKIKPEDVEFVKSCLSDKDNKPDIWDVYDDNLEYNPDNFYEKWVEKEKFK